MERHMLTEGGLSAEFHMANFRLNTRACREYRTCEGQASCESDFEITSRVSDRWWRAPAAMKEGGQGAFRPVFCRRRICSRTTYLGTLNCPVYSEQDSAAIVDEVPVISSRRPDDRLVNAFFSFSTGDHRSASLFDQTLSCALENIQLLGQPVTNRFEKDWQRKCNEKMRHCAFLICLVGENTHRSAAVAWEVGRAIELAMPVLPVALNPRAGRPPPVFRANSIPFLSSGTCIAQSDAFSQISEFAN